MTNGAERQLERTIRSLFPKELASSGTAKVWGRRRRRPSTKELYSGFDGATLTLLTHLERALALDVEDREEEEAPSLWDFKKAEVAHSWLSFHWYNSSAYLYLVDALDGALVWATGEGDNAVLGFLDPCSPATVQMFLKAGTSCTGAKPWLDEEIGDLPSEILNSRPDLCTVESIREAFWEYKVRETRRHPGEWVTFRDRLIGASEQPNHLERSLEILESALKEATRMDELQKQHEREEASLSEADRVNIFDNWFNGAYREGMG